MELGAIPPLRESRAAVFNNIPESELRFNVLRVLPRVHPSENTNAAHRLIVHKSLRRGSCRIVRFAGAEETTFVSVRGRLTKYSTAPKILIDEVDGFFNPRYSGWLRALVRNNLILTGKFATLMI